MAKLFLLVLVLAVCESSPRRWYAIWYENFSRPSSTVASARGPRRIDGLPFPWRLPCQKMHYSSRDYSSWSDPLTKRIEFVIVSVGHPASGSVLHQFSSAETDRYCKLRKLRLRSGLRYCTNQTRLVPALAYLWVVFLPMWRWRGVANLACMCSGRTWSRRREVMTPNWPKWLICDCSHLLNSNRL